MPVLTDNYGPLKGWQWIAAGGAGLGIVLFLRQRAKANAQPAGSPSATGAGAFDPSAIPGFGLVSPIINQLGPQSQPVPTATTPQPVIASNFPDLISVFRTKLTQIPAGSTLTQGAPVYAIVNNSTYGALYSQAAAFKAGQAGQPLYTYSQFITQPGPNVSSGTPASSSA